MSNTPGTSSLHDPHPWVEMSPTQVLDALVYELYGPLSALGSEVDRLSTGAFEDDELVNLLAHIREHVNVLSRVVVTLKRYNIDHRDDHAEPPAEK